MSDAAKPPYRVPSMAEIAAIPPTGFRVVSTFSGCGGSCLGYRLAGFDVVWASEFVPAAQETYHANHPETILDTRDIRTVTAADILDATGLAVGEIDLFDGSPPCSSFSMAGKRAKGWGASKAYSDTVQRTDDLFFEYSRLLRDLRPRTFVAENVAGLVRGVAKGYFREILADLRSAGYEVAARLLDAQWLGVPQARQRLIFIGVRSDLVEMFGVEPAFPTPLPYRYSVRDALPWIDAILTHGRRKTNSEFTVEAETDISRFAIGREWDTLGPGESSAKYFQLARPDADKPCPTITAAGGDSSLASVTHPTERRKFSIAELRRICGFPDDFILTGTYAQQWERLGRAVPPIMMSRVAAAVRDAILVPIRDAGG